MAVILIQSMAGGLVATTQAAASGGDTVQLNNSSDKTVFLRVNNTSGSTATITVADPGVTPAGSGATNPTFTVATATVKDYPLSPRLINPATGLINITYSSNTGLAVAAIRR